MDGARAALEHFGVPDPDGARVNLYAERKQEMVVKLIEAGKFSAYPDALRFLLAVKDAGIEVAAASSSKNAGLFLRQIRLDTFAAQESLDYAWIEPGLTLLSAFDADTSGRHFEHGKPAPDIFLAAAGELGVDPAVAFVVEDAVSGIQAAKAGGFAGLGVARADDEAGLSGAHADIVVSTLDEIDLAGLATGRLTRRPS
jgi:beta-phosphoglucomutase-like phosphatase (HAD superfamily)